MFCGEKFECLGDGSLGKKCVFLIGICYGFTELDVVFKKCIGFNRESLMVLKCCGGALI